MEVYSALPGRVVEVHVGSGQAISAGDLLLTLEVMKMTQEIRAEVGGTVASVAVAAGEEIAPGQVILTMA